MAAGVALPKAYLRKEMKSLLILLGPTMIWMWIISGLCVYLLFPGLSLVRRCNRESSYCIGSHTMFETIAASFDDRLVLHADGSCKIRSL